MAADQPAVLLDVLIAAGDPGEQAQPGGGGDEQRPVLLPAGASFPCRIFDRQQHSDTNDEQHQPGRDEERWAADEA